MILCKFVPSNLSFKIHQPTLPVKVKPQYRGLNVKIRLKLKGNYSQAMLQMTTGWSRSSGGSRMWELEKKISEPG